MGRRAQDLWGEPIDFAALAVARSRKGWRPTRAQKEAWAEKRRKKAKKARTEAGKRFAARKRAEGAKRRKGDGSALHAFLAAFQPGQWYGVADIANASGCNYSSCKAWCVTQRKAGRIERTKNPAFVRAGFLEPEWLYGITEAGVAHLESLAAPKTPLVEIPPTV